MRIRSLIKINKSKQIMNVKLNEKLTINIVLLFSIENIIAYCIRNERINKAI